MSSLVSLKRYSLLVGERSLMFLSRFLFLGVSFVLFVILSLV